MEILITGGAGFIGSHTCVELLEKGHEVVVIDNLSNSNPEALARIQRITGRKPKFYEADAADPNALKKIFSENKIACVIHFAGLKSVGESVRQPLEYYSNNLESALALLSAMERFGVRSLIFSSSATVYSGGNAMPLSEEGSGTGGCANPYGWTKYMQEVIIRDYAAANPDFSAVLLRYFNPVGAHPSGLIGEDPRGLPNNIMPRIAQVAIGKLPCIPIYGNDWPTPDGTGVRDYIHVVDLARGHVLAIDYAMSHRGCEVFNLGTGRPCSVIELIKTYSRVSGRPIPYKFAPRREGDLPVVYSSPEKAKRLLGFKTEKTLEDMCRDGWNWQKNNPQGYPNSGAER